ncbi:hypothetical protein ACVIN2_002591 [Bradyrhizobium sp. USDA 3650]
MPYVLDGSTEFFEAIAAPADLGCLGQPMATFPR